jgi:hypothetical protein
VEGGRRKGVMIGCTGDGKEIPENDYFTLKLMVNIVSNCPKQQK